MAQHLPDISIRQLEYLVAVADAPTWATAATHVGVSASALSQGLAELERRVGVDLFEPQGRRRVLRGDAGPVLDHARQVVALTGDLVRWAERVRSAATGRIRIGMIDVAAVDHYPDVLRTFRSDRPDIDLTLSVAPSAALLADLRAGALDIVICVDPPAPVPGVDVVSLRREPLVVIAPADADIREASTWGPWVLFPDGSHTRHRIVEHLARLGAPLRLAAESHQASVIREMVALGLGWTVLPDGPDLADDRLVRGPVLFERDLVIATRSNAAPSPATDALVGDIARSEGLG